MARQFTFEAIGTGWVIDIENEFDDAQSEKLLLSIHARIDEFDRAYSRFRKDSLVTMMSQKAGNYVLPDDSEELFAVYRKFYDLTEGLFTPLIADVLVDAGYDAEYSLEKKKELTQPPSWDEMISYEDKTLTVKKPILLDFGAAGKGYLIDIVSELLEKNGVTNYCVDAGGDIRRRSTSEPLKIGLEDPEDLSKAIGIVSFGNKSLCASAGSRRKWLDFHHIINPFTLSSPTEVIAVWVIAESTILADALSTSLFFKAPDIFLKHYSFEYLIMKSNRSIEKSATFPAELFLS